MLRFSSVGVLAVLLCLSGCDGGDPDPDGGTTSDAGAGVDGGTTSDAGGDGGTTSDAGGDGGTMSDAGGDGGTMSDAGGDGGTMSDAGSDGGMFPRDRTVPNGSFEMHTSGVADDWTTVRCTSETPPAGPAPDGSNVLVCLVDEDEVEGASATSSVVTEGQAGLRYRVDLRYTSNCEDGVTLRLIADGTVVAEARLGHSTSWMDASITSEPLAANADLQVQMDFDPALAGGGCGAWFDMVRMREGVDAPAFVPGWRNVPNGSFEDTTVGNAPELWTLSGTATARTPPSGPAPDGTRVLVSTQVHSTLVARSATVTTGIVGQRYEVRLRYTMSCANVGVLRLLNDGTAVARMDFTPDSSWTEAVLVTEPLAHAGELAVEFNMQSRPGDSSCSGWFDDVRLYEGI